jgi:hypothetical protein
VTGTPSAGRSREADAVRYLVLRKLAAGLRHALMGELQSIQFLAELGTRLLDSGTDDARLRGCVGKIPAAAGTAIATCHSVIEWLRPEEGASTTLAEAVGQCVALAGDDWRMRAIQATVAMPAPAGEASVSKAAARELVVASLLALTDAKPGPLDIEVVAALGNGVVTLRLDARLSGRHVHFAPPAKVGFAITWDDVALLAAAHGVHLAHEQGVVILQFAPPSPRDVPEPGRSMP